MAGTDPTDAASRFTASVALEDGKPVVSWSPALNGEGAREGVCTCRVWGKESPTDAAWVEVAPNGESVYRFFRVSVETPSVHVCRRWLDTDSDQATGSHL